MKSLKIVIAWVRKKIGQFPTPTKLCFKAISILSVVGLVLTLVGFKQLNKGLPDPNMLLTRDSVQSSIIYDRNGKELFSFYEEENRELIKLEEMPDEIKWAILAAEDIDFYEHKALDYPGIFRCAFTSFLKIITFGKKGQFCGASTITQQLVRNTLLYDVYGKDAFDRSTPFSTVMRKVREIFLTIKVEDQFTKDEILQMYINEIPMGGVNYGIQAASKSYFDKDAMDLDLAESSLLAGLIQGPGQFNPIFGLQPEKAEIRQKYVLSQLYDKSDKTPFSKEEVKEASRKELQYRPHTIKIEAPHFVFDIYSDLIKEYGIERLRTDGLKITTTLDLDMQKSAEKVIQKKIRDFALRNNAHNAASVMLDPHTNQILIYVGSANYFEKNNPFNAGKIDMARTPRQMASSVKPYTYITAFEQGYGPWLLTPDIPMDFGYGVTNYGGGHIGLITAREALVKSVNIPAMYVMDLIGTEDFENTVKRMGISTVNNLKKDELHATLGTKEISLLENVSAYSIFAAEGVKRPIVKILKVKDQNGNVLQEYKPQRGERIFSKSDTYMLNWILCDLGGFNDQLFEEKGYYNINGERAYCGKTGTSDGARDAISMAYHKNLVLGVWIGNTNNAKMPGGVSGEVALPILHEIINIASGEYKTEFFTRPKLIKKGEVCVETGSIFTGDFYECEKEETVYIDDSKIKYDTRELLHICNETGYVASNYESVRFSNITNSKVLIKNNLENSRHEEAYKNYLKENNYLTSHPGIQKCDPPFDYISVFYPEITQEDLDNHLFVIHDPKKEATVYIGDQVPLTVYYFNTDQPPVKKATVTIYSEINNAYKKEFEFVNEDFPYTSYYHAQLNQYVYIPYGLRINDRWIDAPIGDYRIEVTLELNSGETYTDSVIVEGIYS